VIADNHDYSCEMTKKYLSIEDEKPSAIIAYSSL
jgi:hypothetical protein